MKRPFRLFFILILLAALVAACGQATSTPSASTGATASSLPRNAAGYTDLTVSQLADMLPGKDFALVNVHIPYEGELAQTDLFIPYNHITDHLDLLPAKDAPIVLYCRSGRMSTEAATRLAGLGYHNIMELNGGMVAWQTAGYELLHNP